MKIKLRKVEVQSENLSKDSVIKVGPNMRVKAFGMSNIFCSAPIDLFDGYLEITKDVCKHMFDTKSYKPNKDRTEEIQLELNKMARMPIVKAGSIHGNMRCTGGDWNVSCVIILILQSIYDFISSLLVLIVSLILTQLLCCFLNRE